MTAVLRLLAAGSLLVVEAAVADVTFVIGGVEDPLRSNILSHVDIVQFGPQVRLSPADIERVQAQAVEDAREALRPFGYYSPTIETRVIDTDSDQPVVVLDVVPGPPVRVSGVSLGFSGPGAEERVFRSWKSRWPLPDGAILNQQTWEAQKQELLDLAASRGFMSALLTEHTIGIDLERNTAAVSLQLETGPRFVMGDIDFGEHVLRSGILEYVPRFEKGDYYTARLISKFRTDLWKTGYFTDVQVVEKPRPESDPPAVDLQVEVETETRNRYSGALGWGTDTGIRLQAGWSRHPMSSSGGRLDLNVGWRELDDQLRIRGTHRVPRRNRARQFWITDMTLSFENLDLEVKRDEEDEDFVKIASGEFNERHIRFGRMKVRNFDSGEAQSFETLFLQYINSDRKFAVGDNQEELLALTGNPGFDDLLNGVDNALSVGFDLDLVDVQGQRFETAGHRERAWIFHSDDAFGSDVEFTQAYASTRRSYLVGDRLKFLLRGEIGYTDADVRDFSIDVDGEPLDLSVTTLPNFYRFKAGGSMSVRGYGFEQLSDNDIGSNNIVTGSVEGEYRFLDTWSAALFFDIGNAFNDWDDPDLKRGAGIGVRWYSIAGEVRIDYAQAIDFEGRPWRLHITIGTPLL
jgi:translocation and assembly module TamA